MIGASLLPTKTRKPGRKRVPFKPSPRSRVILISVDALCVVAAAAIAGLGAPLGLAAAAILCASFAACKAYGMSYAVRARDESYHAATGMLVAVLPLLLVLHVAGSVSWLQQTAFIVSAFALVVFERYLLFGYRRGTRPAYAGLEAISTMARWHSQQAVASAVKRGFDIAISALALFLLSPLLLVTAIAIAIESGRPVVFRQQRVGRVGTPFTLFKFRTMRRDAGQSWAKPGDERITALGAFLRRTSIDELPQFFNVLRGDMSLVGPRPEMCEYARRFELQFPGYRDRHIVKPGITGWAQVQLKRNLAPSDAPEVLAHDLFYVEYSCLVLDGIIFFKTAAEFLLHRAV
jgi:lipopolysaccharide/colanic/teichoic acid biosynthesis glycosyltransferase